MALTNPTDRVVNLEAKVNFDVHGNFVRAFRMPTYQVLSAGVVVAKNELPPVELTLQQFKDYVANL